MLSVSDVTQEALGSAKRRCGSPFLAGGRVVPAMPRNSVAGARQHKNPGRPCRSYDNQSIEKLHAPSPDGARATMACVCPDMRVVMHGVIPPPTYPSNVAPAVLSAPAWTVRGPITPRAPPVSLLYGKSYGGYKRWLSNCPSIALSSFKAAPHPSHQQHSTITTLHHTPNPHPSQCPTPRFSSTAPLAASPPAGSPWSSSPTRSPRPLRTSALSALARRVLVAPASPSTTRAPASTASSPSSCFRVVTSPAATAPVVRASTARSSRTRTST